MNPQNEERKSQINQYRSTQSYNKNINLRQ